MRRLRAALVSTAAAGALLAAGCAPSDATLTENVKAKLASDETVKTADIQVETNDRVVTLSGTVESQAVKERAVTLARGTGRVENVVDQLTVKEPAPTTGTFPPGPGGTGHEGMERGAARMDHERMASEVRQRFRADDMIRMRNIEVAMREDGVVMLSGRVASEAERQRAIDIARRTPGVSRVDDRMQVRR